MKINGIVIKIGSTMMILFLVVLIPLGVLIDRIFLQIYSTEVHQRVNDLSRNVTEILLDNNQSDSKLLEYTEMISGKEIVLFNQQGVITSESVFEYVKNEKMPIDIVHIMQEGKHFEREYVNPITNEHYFYVGRPIIEDDTFKGGVLIFSSINEIHQTMHDVRTWIIGSIVVAIVLALGFTFFVSKRLSKPLIEMEKATRSIAKGDLTSKVRIHTQDEIGSLAQAINDLSIELNNYRVNRSELLANISHELRTPISYLKGYAQLINGHQYQNNEELESYSDIIVKESDRLAKLIQELFELSKMEEGRMQLYMQSIDIEDLIESATQKVNLKAQNKKLTLISSVDQNLPSIISDGSRIEQILLNLLENAINYTNKGEIIVRAEKIKDGIRITVRDSGIGIPQDDLPFVFERFHRVEKSRSREMGGTGLGLAIVSKLVQQLHGEITVTSELGKGSEFTLTLPENINNG